MNDPKNDPAGSGPDILARYVAEQEQNKLEEQYGEETLAARKAVLDLPAGHGGDSGKADPALADLSTDELKQRLMEQTQQANPEAYQNWSPTLEDEQRARRIREAK